MSGGSFDYFYSRAPEELQRVAGTLAEMARRCAEPSDWNREGVDPADLAVVGAYLQAMSIKVEGLAKAIGKLEQVTHDIEWWQSGDSGADRVIESFRKLETALNRSKE